MKNNGKITAKDENGEDSIWDFKIDWPELDLVWEPLELDWPKNDFNWTTDDYWFNTKNVRIM